MERPGDMRDADDECTGRSWPKFNGVYDVTCVDVGMQRMDDEAYGGKKKSSQASGMLSSAPFGSTETCGTLVRGEHGAFIAQRTVIWAPYTRQLPPEHAYSRAHLCSAYVRPDGASDARYGVSRALSTLPGIPLSSARSREPSCSSKVEVRGREGCVAGIPSELQDGMTLSGRNTKKIGRLGEYWSVHMYTSQVLLLVMMSPKPLHLVSPCQNREP
jgi:hypothetical protein